MSSWTDWKLSDIIWGILIPCIVAFLIIIFPFELSGILMDVDPEGVLNAILVEGLGQAILIVAIPLFAGLIWNKWAGGAAGFLLGSIYALYVNDTYAAWAYATPDYGAFNPDTMMLAGSITVLGYVVSSMLVGYMSGALNRGSYSFRRMVVAALIAGIIAGIIELWTGLLDGSMITDVGYSAFLILLPKLIYGIVIPIFVTLFGWFGISPRQMV
ncbi:MAG: hypothetical protein PVI43_06370 [Candidatus Bathyarchaeota archaeon]|jgi:hypothetical protein